MLEQHNQFLKDLDPRDNTDEEEVKDSQVFPAELTIDVPIYDEDGSRIVNVGSQLSH